MHCLNLKITYNCTNNCSFCFSSYLKDNVISYEGLREAVENGYINGCRELVISGGEPTLLPDTIISILGIADVLGYEKFIIQTNGSGLSDNDELLAILDEIAIRKELCISFSVHSYTSEIHDMISVTAGAFEKLIKAMKKVSQTHCIIYTNTVISRANINHLNKIATIIKLYGAEIIQFSMMHLEVPGALSTGLLEAALVIRQLTNDIDLNILKTEGIPYCLMYGIEQCVGESFWPDSLDLYNKEDDYVTSFNQLEDGMRWKADSCEQCVMNEMCMGIWKEHALEFQKAGISPIC